MKKNAIFRVVIIVLLILSIINLLWFSSMTTFFETVVITIAAFVTLVIGYFIQKRSLDRKRQLINEERQQLTYQLLS